MKNVIKNVIVAIIAIAVSAIDFFNNGNGYIQLVLALAAAFAVFNMPHLPELSGKPKVILHSILFAGNVVLLALTFTHRVFLINMLLLSYTVWSLVTPKLLKFKALLPVSFMLSFVCVYAACFTGISIPLFIVVFYPVYVMGAILNRKNIIKTKKIWLFGILNLLFSAALLVLIIYGSLGRSVLESILFVNIYKPGTVSAVYLPFIALFLTWFAVAANSFFYMLSSGFEKSNTAFDLTSYFKPVFNFVHFFAVVVISTFICEFSIRLDIPTTAGDFLHPNILFNILVFSGVYLCLISILGKGISNVIAGIFVIFLTVANFLKFTYFDEPFYPWDIYMIKNMFGISRDYLSLPVIIALALVLAAAVFLIIRFRRNLGRALKPKVSIVLIPFALVLFLLNANVLTDHSLSVQIGIERSWYIGKSEILTNGMYTQNYFYLADLDKYLNPKPAGYSKNTMQAISDKYQDSNEKDVPASVNTSAVKPNVIAIMSESYWDLTRLNGIKLSKDVAENVHKYQKGELAPPAIGGGTANTEFEALTGMSLYFMSPGIIAYNTYLRTETPSIASVFKDNGYSTTAIHPNAGWFYNRDKVYNYFGFENFYDVSSFDMSTQTKGPHISDYALVDKILDTLDSSDKPAFIFAVSMENHDPFNDKFSNFDVNVESDQLDASQRNIVNGLAQGLYDADQSLGKLIDALSKSDKPTLLYFFGDHAPRMGSLDDYYKIYDKLGVKDEGEQKQGIGELKYYTTPLVTWSNYRDMRSFSSIISPSHIAYEILNDAGVSHPNYFNILPELESTYPILHLKNMDIVDPESELVKDYQLIQYDLLFGNKYLGGN